MLKKLEIGCGDRPTPGYLHQDVTTLPGVNLDFTCNPWEVTLQENSIDEILALGVMEHLRFKEVEKTLTHFRKILSPGGVFLFDVPDIRVWSEYLYNLTHGKEKELPPFEMGTQHVLNTFYGWQRWPGDEHKSAWTYESIRDKALEAGFSNFKRDLDEFRKRGIERRRFNREWDAHVYGIAIK